MQTNNYWLDLFQRQKDSGKTVEEFCKSEHVSCGHFYRKKRELASTESGGDSSFTPVKLEEETPTKPAYSKTVEFSIDGHSIICKRNDLSLIIEAFK